MFASIRFFALCTLAACVPLAQAGNLASQDQQGTDNLAIVDQREGMANQAEQVQEGSSNVSNIVQQNNGNVARTLQAGPDNRVRVEQSLVANRVVVQQTSTGYGNEATVIQNGVLNDAEVVQTFGRASLYQEGTGNGFQVVQTVAGNSLDGSSIGAGNRTVVNQYGGGIATTAQYGEDNRIVLTQDAPYFGATARITQEGTQNEVDVTQLGNGRYTGGRILLDQKGQGNVMQVNNNAALGLLDFTQDGEGNELVVGQHGRDDSVVGSSRGGHNRVQVSQDYENSLTLSQEGFYNEIEVEQGPEGNEAAIVQFGDANQVSLTQRSARMVSSTATITQTGSGNRSIVMQP
ncbi:hypothetical protein DN824_20610 [Stutzerimonas nosocomialis]|uniref:hypothetical protein n=1 Tax=Stutzerimonas nosocomialis TaxID=1056496 RepID=UPI00110990D6|nr:hypothetical protein [Stutzerimonas nosocomialis]TLX54831.1 hypothetical protein DN824_20610 [Stutzerimonas nosocomialis]